MRTKCPVARTDPRWLVARAVRRAVERLVDRYDRDNSTGFCLMASVVLAYWFGRAGFPAEPVYGYVHGCHVWVECEDRTWWDVTADQFGLRPIMCVRRGRRPYQRECYVRDYAEWAGAPICWGASQAPSPRNLGLLARELPWPARATLRSRFVQRTQGHDWDDGYGVPLNVIDAPSITT
jgi:hypothetical protein